jgi:hypothetical protein
MDWHKCRFLESCENLKPLVKMRFGREPSTSLAREIVACLQQGRLFYQAAETSPIEIRPLQLFYGMVGFAKALIVARQLRSLSSLKHAHGVSDVSAANSRIADLRLKIGEGGTFQEFNDAVRDLSRVTYSDRRPKYVVVSFASASSNQISGVELSLRDILGRVPGLESLYQMTFDETAPVANIGIDGWGENSGCFILSIQDPRVLTDLNSLKQIVEGWRARFPFLKMWQLFSAEQAWGTRIRFINMRDIDVDEFAEANAAFGDGRFQTQINTEDSERFTLEQGLAPFAGYLLGGTHAVSPVKDFYLSEFSLQYLGLFLLSSLVRYRPQTCANAISGSIILGEPADDKTLSLIESFLDQNRKEIPEIVVSILNPHEDHYYDKSSSATGFRGKRALGVCHRARIRRRGNSDGCRTRGMGIAPNQCHTSRNRF